MPKRQPKTALVVVEQPGAIDQNEQENERPSERRTGILVINQNDRNDIVNAAKAEKKKEKENKRKERRRRRGQNSEQTEEENNLDNKNQNDRNDTQNAPINYDDQQNERTTEHQRTGGLIIMTQNDETNRDNRNYYNTQIMPEENRIQYENIHTHGPFYYKNDAQNTANPLFMGLASYNDDNYGRQPRSARKNHNNPMGIGISKRNPPQSMCLPYNSADNATYVSESELQNGNSKYVFKRCPPENDGSKYNCNRCPPENDNSIYNCNRCPPENDNSIYNCNRCPPENDDSKYNCNRFPPENDDSKYNCNRFPPENDDSKYNYNRFSPENDDSKYNCHRCPPVNDDSKYNSNRFSPENDDSKHASKRCPSENDDSKHASKRCPSENDDSKHASKRCPSENDDSKHASKRCPPENYEYNFNRCSPENEQIVTPPPKNDISKCIFKKYSRETERTTSSPKNNNCKFFKRCLQEIEPPPTAEIDCTPQRSCNTNELGSLYEQTRKWITVYGVSVDNKKVILKFFENLGKTEKSICPEHGNYFHLKYETYDSALTALSYNEKFIANDIMVGVTVFNDAHIYEENTKKNDNSYCSPKVSSALDYARSCYDSKRNNKLIIVPNLFEIIEMIFMFLFNVLEKILSLFDI